MIYLKQDWEDVGIGDEVTLVSKKDRSLRVTGRVRARLDQVNAPAFGLSGSSVIRFPEELWEMVAWSQSPRERSTTEKECSMSASSQQGPWPGMTIREGDGVTLQYHGDDNSSVSGKVTAVTGAYILVAGIAHRFGAEGWTVLTHDPAPLPLPTEPGVYVVDNADLPLLVRLYRLAPSLRWIRLDGTGERYLNEREMRDSLGTRTLRRLDFAAEH